MQEKTIAIRVDEELHREIRLRTADLNITLKDYIVSLVKQDLKSKNKINWKAASLNETVNEESVKEAQKILDFVNDVISGKFSPEEKIKK